MYEETLSKASQMRRGVTRCSMRPSSLFSFARRVGFTREPGMDSLVIAIRLGLS